MQRIALGLSRRLRWRCLALLAVIAASCGIVSTYRVFNQTNDESAHLAAGMEWLSKGTFTYEKQHPPLGRIAAAIGPYLAGERTHGMRSMWTEGTAILGHGDHYVRTLALSRLGELPFFLILCAVVWGWGRRLMDERGAALAVVFAATNPTLLAHAGLSTTDIGPTALVIATLLAFACWLDRPGWRETLVLGAVAGAAALTKFSAIPFLGLAFALAYGVRASARKDWILRRASGGPAIGTALAVSALAAFLVVWATYRFEIAPFSAEWPQRLPAASFFSGVYDFILHGALGHRSFLLGHLKSDGWWYYFPVALLVKTPLPLLLCGAIGIVAAIRAVRGPDGRNAWEALVPLAGIAAVLGVALTSKVNIGVRHVLPVYPLLALLAAQGALTAWAWTTRLTTQWRPVLRVAVVALLLSTVISPVRAHPDLLSYFNPLAGAHPERVLVDSNLDWGQDLYRLRGEMRQRGITSLHLAYFGTAVPESLGVFGTRGLPYREHTAGWIAVSETYMAGEWVDDAYYWLRQYEPVTRIGKSMRLYYVPPQEGSARVLPTSARATRRP